MGQKPLFSGMQQRFRTRDKVMSNVNESPRWCTIESDPKIFTLLTSRLGIKNVRFEEIYDFEHPEIFDFDHVFGFVFLFKWENDDQKPSDNQKIFKKDFYFARQYVSDACATQAILNIFLNSDVILNEDLRLFKEFTKDFEPSLKGEAIGNSVFIRNAHNSFATVHLQPSDHNHNNDSFHFVGFIPYGQCVVEIDGLKNMPIIHESNEENFARKTLDIVRKKITR